MKPKTMKITKTLSMLLALIMIIGVFAAAPVELTVSASSGDGTEADPYVVTTYSELKQLMYSVKETRYIKLGGNIISNDTLNLNTLLVNGGNIILDLAGYTLERTSSVTSDTEMISLIHGSLTIKDSSAGGTGQVISHLGQNSENLNISSGTDLITVDGAYAQLTIDGGTFTNKINFGEALDIVHGTVTINGGTFIASYHKYGDSIPMPYSLSVNSADAEIFINGGTFYYGMYFRYYTTVHITNCTVTRDESLQKGEALIYFGDGASLTQHVLSEKTTVTIDGVVDDTCNFATRGKEIVIYTPKPVRKVAIEGIVPPVSGAAPSNIVGANTVLENCSIAKYISGEHVGENIIEWVDVNTMNPVDTFVEGRNYMVTVCLEADEGFVFSTKVAEYETLTVNGDDDAFVWKVQNDGKYAYIGYIFTCPAAQNITSMGANVTGFELLNSYFDVKATPLNSSKYTIRNITWTDCHLTDDSPIITDSSMFEAGETWQLKLWFKPAYGYAIKNPETLPVTIGGQTATYVGKDGDYYGYKIEKTFSKYLHDYIDLSMDAPTAGMTPAEYAETIKIKNNDRFPYNNFEIGEVQCYRADWNDFSTFAAGTTYYVYVEINLKDDTSFEFAHHDSDITALLNGTAVEDYVVVDSDSTWKSSFDTYGGVKLIYNVYFTAKGEQTGTTAPPTTTAPTTVAPTTAVKPTTTEPTTVITPFMYGDLNRDGKVSLLDLIALRKYLAKWSVDVDTAAADCNADSKITLLDLILMRKYLAKWDVKLGPQA